MNTFSVGQRVPPVSEFENVEHAAATQTPNGAGIDSGNTCKMETGGTRCPTWLLIVALCLICAGLVAQEPGSKETVRFRAVDISLDTKDKPLAAYQLEFLATAGDVKIVGIEGGEHSAFAQPPFYDPKAMQQDRVITAAFSTEVADKLPKGKTRVATIHIQTKGAVEPKFELKLQVAADAGGNKITAQASVEERNVK